MKDKYSKEKSKSNMQPLKFDPNRDFQNELSRRVDEFLKSTGRKHRDCVSMYVKSVIILSCFSLSYILLVFYANTFFQAILLSIILGLSTAGIGFNIQHDGGHNAYSNHAWVNKLAALTMDLVGGSSYVWKYKHVVLHHRNVNITGYDPDIEIGYVGRLSPHQPKRSIYRWQHIYLWPLYGLLAIKWHIYDDFASVIFGKIGPQSIPRPKKMDLVIFILGKVVFFSLAFVVPLMFHSIQSVLLFYSITAVVLGMTMSLIFQLPHCVEETAFPLPESNHISTPWAVYQAQVTMDFCRRNPILTWPLGGLNHHLEHHLFPIICHVNYPAISKVVEETCKEYGIPFKEHVSFWSGLKSHFRWLKQMGFGKQ